MPRKTDLLDPLETPDDVKALLDKALEKVTQIELARKARDLSDQTVSNIRKRPGSLEKAKVETLVRLGVAVGEVLGLEIPMAKWCSAAGKTSLSHEEIQRTIDQVMPAQNRLGHQISHFILLAPMRIPMLDNGDLRQKWKEWLRDGAHVSFIWFSDWNDLGDARRTVSTLETLYAELQEDSGSFRKPHEVKPVYHYVIPLSKPGLKLAPSPRQDFSSLESEMNAQLDESPFQTLRQTPGEDSFAFQDHPLLRERLLARWCDLVPMGVWLKTTSERPDARRYELTHPRLKVREEGANRTDGVIERVGDRPPESEETFLLACLLIESIVPPQEMSEELKRALDEASRRMAATLHPDTLRGVAWRDLDTLTFSKLFEITKKSSEVG